MDFISTLIISLVEGITEFLPVSSTAHMVFTCKLLGVKETNFVKIFQICIQIGAIFSVVILFYKEFFNFKRIFFHYKLTIAIIPAVILGTIFGSKISDLLDNHTIITLVLILGGIILLFIDKIFHNPKIQDEKNISIKQSFIIGLWQCLGMIPGVSRSGASIIGGMQQNLTRQLASEFSFFIAVPTIFAATCYSLFIKNWNENGVVYKGYEIILLSKEYYNSFIIGTIIAFIVSILTMKVFMFIVQKHGLKIWGWYRIIAGIILFITFNYMQF